MGVTGWWVEYGAAGTRTAAAAPVGAGRVGKVGAGPVTVTVARAGTATMDAACTGTRTVTAARLGAGTAVGAGTQTATATATGVGAGAGAGTRSVTATATGVGVVGTVGVGTLTATATGTGTAGGVGTLTATATGTGTGAAAAGVDGSLTATATAAGAGSIAGAGTRTVTATATGVGVVGKVGAGTRSVTATLTGTPQPFVIFDAATDVTQVNSDLSSPYLISGTHTASGSNRYAVVYVWFSQGSSVGALGQSCTYGGVSMTLLGSRSANNIADTAAGNFMQVWGLANPATGSQTVTATMTHTSGTLSDIAMTIMTFSNVGSIDTAVVDHGTESGTSLSQTISCDTGDMVVAGFAEDEGSATALASLSITERGNQVTNSGGVKIGIVGTVAGTSPSVTVTATRGSGNDYCEIGVNLNYP